MEYFNIINAILTKYNQKRGVVCPPHRTSKNSHLLLNNSRQLIRLILIERLLTDDTAELLQKHVDVVGGGLDF